MSAPDWANRSTLQHWAFAALVVAVSLVFVWVLAPFYEAIVWAAILAVLFAPMQRRLTARLGERRSSI